MNVVVTGATGFIGHRLVRRLIDQGHSVTAWTRDAERAAISLPARCAVARWEPSSCDPAQVPGAGVVVLVAAASQELLEDVILDYLEVEPGQFRFVFARGSEP